MKQLIKFTAVGSINTLIDWTVYLAVVTVFPAESAAFYSVAKGFSYFCGILNSFLLNNAWTFKDLPDRKAGIKLIKFLLVNMIGIGLNGTSIYFFLNINTGHTTALILATIITFGFNFILCKLWVFRGSKAVSKITGG
jgi:putative flippase GtrA